MRRHRQVWGLAACVSLCGCAAEGRLGPVHRGTRPDRVQAQLLNEQALECIGKSQFAEAQSLLEQALQSDPFLGPAHSNLGLVLQHAGHIGDAARELQAACSLMPNVAPPRRNLALIFEVAGRYVAAENELRAALAIDPDDIQVVGQFARLHVRQKKWTGETVSWLERVVARDDDPAWREWARRQLNLGKRSTSPEE